ncbi:MAG: phosphoribosylglycinamide formyltransferase [Gammaproteobacteria bacterium]
MNTAAPMPVVVMISGSGTNLQAIIDAAADDLIPIQVKAVLSDVPGAFGLERARQAGVPAECLPASEFGDRASFDQALGRRLQQLAPDLVVLAGFMRILSAPLVRAWSGRMLNIHPSLLPAYRGLHTHRRVLAAGEEAHGTSVHFVTEELDGGPLIAQARIRIGAEDTEASLNRRIQALEHRLYPLVIGWFGSGRLRLGGGGVEFDGAPLQAPIIRDEAELLGA